jgi:hypothetical protein
MLSSRLTKRAAAGWRWIYRRYTLVPKETFLDGVCERLCELVKREIERVQEIVNNLTR